MKRLCAILILLLVCGQPAFSMTYMQKVDFVNNKNPYNLTIRQRLEAAIAKAAIYALDDGGMPSATIKANAKKALENTAQEVSRFAWYMAFDATIEAIVDGGGSPTEAQIQTLVDAKRNVAWGT